MRVPSPSVCTTVVVASAENGAPVTTGPASGSAFLGSNGTHWPDPGKGPLDRRPWAALDCTLSMTRPPTTHTDARARRDVMGAPVVPDFESRARTGPHARDHHRPRAHRRSPLQTWRQGSRSPARRTT